MAIYGVDIHPRYQAGISIEQIRAEGFDFMACKLSEGTGVYDSQDWLRRGKACGLLCLGYHYLRPGNEPAQAAVFAEQLARTGVPGMLDAEALAGDERTPTLSVAGIRRFLAEATARGARVPLLYLPRWYWERLGSPDLSGLPPLWASSYVNGSGYASALYETVTPSRWAPYGGLGVEVLQFSDKATVAGHLIDANHYRGTYEQFAALIDQEDQMTPQEVWNYPVSDPYVGPDGKPRDAKPAHVLLSYGAANAAYAVEEAKRARAELDALKAALPGMFAAAIAGSVVDVDVTVHNKTGIDE